MLNELGFRGDIHSRKPSSVIVEGAYNRTSIYESSPDALVVAPYSENQTNQDMITTADLLAKWSLEEKNGAETTVQGYYDYLDYPYTNASSSTGTWDLDLQQQFPASKFGNLIVGGGYRYLLNNSSPGPTQTLIPLDRRDTVYNVFGQDQIKVSAKGQLTLGLKLEQNTYTGFEYEPSGRVDRQLYRVQSAIASGHLAGRRAGGRRGDRGRGVAGRPGSHPEPDRAGNRDRTSRGIRLKESENT